MIMLVWQGKVALKINTKSNSMPAISLYKGELQIALVNKSHLFLSLSLDVIIIIIFVKL